MNIDEIVVSEVNKKEFERMYKQWYTREKNGRRTKRLKIENPLHAPNYRSLLENFIKHPKAKRISVNHQGSWIQKGRFEWNDEILNHLAEIAQNDSVKKGHLDLLIGEGHYYECLKIVCAETSKGIIGYEITIPDAYKGEVTWKTPALEGPHRFLGLWDRPEDCKLLGSFKPIALEQI